MRRLPVSLGSVQFVLFALVVAAGVEFAPEAAFAQAAFHAVGDLPGGSFSSQVRDATKAGGVIYAVGSSSAQNAACGSPCPNPDTAILWRWDGVSATMTALPNLAVNTTGTSFISAAAITPDGAYIASRARNATIGNQRQAVRVTTALLPFPSANLNLSLLFSPALSPNTAAAAISSDGSILYGFNSNRALRFDVSGASSAIIPLLSGMTTASTASRGTSADGSVMVGTTSNGSTRWAYRYLQGSGSALIPRLAGGTWNSAEAVSPDGNLVLVAGDSSAYPNGEVYLYDATAGKTTSLGSPNTPWSPNEGGFAGMTPDGSVVAISFGGPTRGFAYFRNNHGWFHLRSALAASGIDLKAQGWTELGVLGMSSDGTLVFGQGVHDGEIEGYVAEFPAGYLAGFDVPAVAPSDTSIVGAWRAQGPDSPSPAIVVFMADGTYYLIQPSVDASEINAAPGLERGLYRWDAATGAFAVTTLLDTNGDAGLSDDNGGLGLTVFVSGDTLSFTPGGAAVATRITPPANTPLKNTLVGGWVVGDAAAADSSIVVVFDADGTYYFAHDGPIEGGARDGIEAGTFTWDPFAHILAATSIAVDTNGDWGLSDPFGPITFLPFVDGLVATADDTSGPLTARRVIDPNSVIPVITSPPSATGNLAAAFSYAVIATNGASAFGASGLPAGLSIDPSTGVISGTPTVLGSFNVAVSASNTLRTGTAALSIVIVTTVTTSAGTNVSVAPAVPEGAAPVTITFDSVSAGGETTLAVIEPGTGPATVPPAGFSLGDPPVYYEVSTTATFSGPATLCFSYAGVNFGSGTPRLFHFVSPSWVDITTSVDPGTSTICGAATSFSPFAIFVSPIRRTGFYSPVSPVAGYMNTVKGGSTVPLKFNVYVGGVEKTDTAGLLFSVAPVSCAPAAEDPVDFVTTGATTLRYDTTARQFVQNWQTPKAPGSCYLVRMTTVADGLSISALFKMK